MARSAALPNSANSRIKLQSSSKLFTIDEMKLLQAKLFFSLALVIIFLNACAGNEKANLNSAAPIDNSNSTAATAAKDDIEELGKIIKLPFVPEEATYNEFDFNNVNSAPRSSSPAPNERRLVAVLKFTDDAAKQIAANAEKYKPVAPADIDAENWFPPELVAKSQETGDSSLKGVEYAANDFLQSPFVNGKLTRLNETNYFVLELF